MINLVLTIFILLANIVAILLVYYSFDKKIEKSKRLMYTMIAMGVMYILILIVYFFSSIGIGNKEVTKNAKSMITFTFVPVNTIIILPILIRGYNKRKNNEIENITEYDQTVFPNLFSLLQLSQDDHEDNIEWYHPLPIALPKPIIPAENFYHPL